MVDTNKLRGRIVEKFGSSRSFAEEIGMNEATLSRKLNNDIEFRYDEVIATNVKNNLNKCKGV